MTHKMWLNAIIEFNSELDTLIENRNKCFNWMMDRVKTAFTEAGNPVPKVTITPRGDEIHCVWVDTVKLVFDEILVSDLQMEFDFTRKLGDDGYWIKEVIFYPFGRNEES